ncbi:MAG: hypothetical protein J6V83_02570 [Clostridia bacterium]|nr:hypothetical protein [Clostridia bacterium]MBO7156268.1 hypothetical protein [Clostridia bacterium]
MKKIDKTIIKETLYILVCVIILSAVMQSVFLIIHKWDYTVLLGNLLTGFAVTLNFFLMGLGVQKSLGKEEKEAKKVIRISQIYRYLILIAFLIIGVVFSCFNNWTVFIPILFPRIAIAIRPLFNKKEGVTQAVSQEVSKEPEDAIQVDEKVEEQE